MFYKKYRLVPTEMEERTKRDPFESTHAQRARDGLNQLLERAADDGPISTDDRLERQQALVRYKKNYETALTNSTYGTLQETLGKESESKGRTELEDMLRKFLKQRVDARETHPVAEREVAMNAKPEKKQKELPFRSTTTRTRTSPYPTADKRSTKREGDKRDRQQNYSPPSLRSTKHKTKNPDVAKWKNVL